MSRPVAGLPIVGRLFGVWTGLVLAFLYLPIGVLIAYSFNRAGPEAHWRGFTLAGYVDLRHDAKLVEATENSLIVAAIATVVSTVLGTAGAWLGHRYRLRVGPVPVGRAVLSLAYVPVVMPDVVVGVGLFSLFAVAFRTDTAARVNDWWAARGHADPLLAAGLGTLVLSHVTFCFPFVLVAVRARLAGLDPSLEEAAQDLGATPARAFASVVLPYLLPAVAAGAMMAFTLSLDELIVSAFTRGTTDTLPTVIYGRAGRVGLQPTLNAVSAVFVVGTVAIMVVAERLRRVRGGV